MAAVSSLAWRSYKRKLNFQISVALKLGNISSENKMYTDLLRYLIVLKRDRLVLIQLFTYLSCLLAFI